MRNFCTLFDVNYLTRGLVLYRSLKATGEVFTLYVVCFDGVALEILQRLALPDLVPVQLEQFESAALRQVKKSRSVAEYCWTCTSHVIRHALESFRLGEVTYLDADLYFFQRPSLVLEEYEKAGASVLLTEHRFSPQLSSDIKFGRYCVQFMTFKNDRRGRKALEWWCERTLEWCHAKLEHGRFGDQKYLDDWLQRFEGVYVSSHIGAGVANWNLQQYAVSGSSEAPMVNGVPAVFFHFHSVKLYTNGLSDLGYKPLPREAVELFYRPYLRRLVKTEKELTVLWPGFSAGRARDRNPLTRAISYMLRKPRGTYNVYRLL